MKYSKEGLYRSLIELTILSQDPSVYFSRNRILYHFIPWGEKVDNPNILESQARKDLEELVGEGKATRIIISNNSLGSKKERRSNVYRAIIIK